MSDPSVDPFLEVGLLAWVKFASATSHDVTVARDGVRHVEVLHSVGEKSTADLSVAAVCKCESIETTWLDMVVPDEVRSNLSQTGSDFVQRVVWKRCAELLRERPEYHPVITSEAWWSQCSTSLLDATVHVHVCAIFLEVAGSRKDKVSIVYTLVSRSAQVNDESIFRDVFMAEIVSAEQYNNFGAIHALAWHDTEIKSTDAACIRVQDVDSIPAFSFVDHVGVLSDNIDQVLDRLTVSSREGIISYNDHRELSLSQSLTEWMGSVGDLLKSLE